MPGGTRPLRHALVGGAIAWTAALPAAAWAMAHAPLPWVPAFAAAAIYAAGALLCHQLPERSFHVWGQLLPVCARCTGIYLGGALVGAASLMRSVAIAPAPPARVRRILVLAAVPVAISLGYEWATGTTPANWIRFLTGVVGGVAVMWTLIDSLGEPPRAATARRDAVN